MVHRDKEKLINFGIQHFANCNCMSSLSSLLVVLPNAPIHLIKVIYLVLQILTIKRVILSFIIALARHQHPENTWATQKMLAGSHTMVDGFSELSLILL